MENSEIIDGHNCIEYMECDVIKIHTIMTDKNNEEVSNIIYWVLDDTEYWHSIVYCPYCGIKLQ